MTVSNTAVHWILSTNAWLMANFATQIIDFDISSDLVAPAPNRPLPPEKGPIELAIEAEAISETLESEGLYLSAAKLRGYAAFIRHLIGQRFSLADYVKQTYLFSLDPIGSEFIERSKEEASSAAKNCGSTLEELAKSKYPFEEKVIKGKSNIINSFEGKFEHYKTKLEKLVDKSLDFKMKFEFVELDEYWSYWVDGSGEEFRLRFNKMDEGISESSVDQFVLHELIGHCGQATSWREEIKANNLCPVLGLTSVQTFEQPHLEGFAQALPILAQEICDDRVIALAKKDILRQALLFNAYISAERGDKIEVVEAEYLKLLPVRDKIRFFKDIRDQRDDPSLFNYLLSYGKGLQTFADAIARRPDKRKHLLEASFARPMTVLDIEGFK